MVFFSNKPLIHFFFRILPEHVTKHLQNIYKTFTELLVNSKKINAKINYSEKNCLKIIHLLINYSENNYSKKILKKIQPKKITNVFLM